MKSAYKLAGLLLLVGLVLPIKASTPDKREFTKSVNKEYAITANGTTALSNKYGKIDVKTWDRQRVKISVNILVNANSESNAQEVFDRIDIAFSNRNDYVKTETVIESKKSRWFSWSNGDKSDYEINYEVFLPKTNNLDVTHKYGDLAVADMEGRVNLDIKYVNFKVEGMGDDSNITFSYGNGAINKARDLNLIVGYGKLSLDEAADLTLQSKYSELSVGSANDVNCSTKYDTYNFGSLRDFRNQGKYDNFRIGKASNVEVAGKYTNLSTGEVEGDIELDLEYGGANFTLAKSFGECQLNGRYTDFAVTVARGTSYKLDAVTNYAGIRYPNELDVQYEKEQTSSHELRGSVGQGVSEILARLSYGSLKVRAQ